MVIVINYCCRESKRKTAAVVALRNNERLFGDAALNTVSRRGIERERVLEGGSKRERESIRLANLSLCTLCGEEGPFLVYMLVRVVKDMSNQAGRKYKVTIFLIFISAGC